jgi:hypothetical protein
VPRVEFEVVVVRFEREKENKKLEKPVIGHVGLHT